MTGAEYLARLIVRTREALWLLFHPCIGCGPWAGSWMTHRDCPRHRDKERNREIAARKRQR